MQHPVITDVIDASPAALVGVRPGERLVRVNGREPLDIIEYQQMTDEPEVRLDLLGEEGERTVLVSKGAGEPLGLLIESAVFDRIRTCDNHCPFCFIYQLPKGMRRSLYVKDDDYRLSFLYGNFTTLTRFTELDFERVVTERISPLYVSIHTTDPELRAAMLRNPRGATSLRWLRELLAAGIEVHGQVVLCPGVNDGEHLERTLLDVLDTYPTIASVGVVPLGVSKFSTESTMRAHEPHEAKDAIEIVRRYQEAFSAVRGARVVHASDELYLIAGEQPPGVDELDGLDQAENGVGMWAAFARDFRRRRRGFEVAPGFFSSLEGAPALGYRAPRGASADDERRHERLVVLTGAYARPLLAGLLDEAKLDAEVLAVDNDYFGGNISVAGLLCFADIERACERAGADATFLLPDVCLSNGRFLDGKGLDALHERGFDVRAVATEGAELRRTLETLGARR